MEEEKKNPSSEPEEKDAQAAQPAEQERGEADAGAELQASEQHEPAQSEQQQAPSPALPPALQDPVRVIESALFQSSKPLSIDDFVRLTGIAAPGHVENLVKQLQKEYADRASPIQIVFEAGLWVMRLRSEFAQAVAEFAKEAEVSKGGLRLLAFISKNEGATQSKAVKVLGSTVYDYVKELSENGFITADKKGRSRVLKTTQKFKDYFAG